jgi:hypothetical protein
MKTFLLSLSLLFFIGACKDVDDLLTFEISDSFELTIASGSPLNLPIELATPDVATNSSQKFENNNTKAELVKDIRLKTLNLEITDPVDKTFNFLKSIEIYISTNGNNEILLAHLYDIPQDVNTIELIPTSEKLDIYVKSSTYQLRTKIITQETLSQEVDLTGGVTFKVTADPL